MKKTLGFALLLSLAAAPSLLAQFGAATGNIYGNVTDASGAVLPGAAVTLSGAFGTQSTVAGTQGEFRFLTVPHGTHKVTVGLTGFTTVNREVTVVVGSNVNLTFVLKVASVEESITVTAETPLVDTKKIGLRTTIDKDELAKIPNSRDPWGILQTIPGVLVDRVNLAGNESGQQANYMGKGSDPKNNTWAIDGVVITDMATRGASPTYYTFDSFDQVAVTSGGNDIAVATGGVGISFATKRGTNSWHGSAVGFLAHDKLQSGNVPDELARDARLLGNDKADHTEQISDYNFDLGGPIVKDRLWVWGSWGREDIRIKRLTQTQDKTELVTKTAKVNWQPSSKDMISAFWFLGSKVKIGRGTGSGLSESSSYLWDQGDLFPRHPHGLSKVEWNRTFSPNFFLNGKWAYYSTGFSLGARDSRANDQIWDNVRQEARGNAQSADFQRPQTTWQLDGNYFFGGMGGNHELKFGGSWKKTRSQSATIYSGNKTRATFNTATVGEDRARFFRDSLAITESKYYTFYVADTFTKDRLTLNLGLRYDQQEGAVAASNVPANPLISNLLPAVSFAGGGQGIQWKDLSPRVGLTFALDEARKTVARASFARYAGQLQTGDAGFDSPFGVVAFLEYAWADANRDEKIQLPEVRFDQGIRASGGVNPNNPGAVGASVNRIDPNLSADKDWEIVLGIDRELGANLAAGAGYTWRKSVDPIIRGIDAGVWAPRIGVTSADYSLGAPVSRNGYTITPYALNAGVTTRAGVTGGQFFTNRPDFYRLYGGLELTLTKRLSNKWMARGAFSWMDWTDHLKSANGHHPNPNPTDLDPALDGGQVIRQGFGSGKAIYINAKWQFSGNLLYQLPGGFEIATSVYARQGYPRPIFIQAATGAFEGTVNVLAVPAVDANRLPTLFDIDLRLAKNVKIGGSSLTLSAEAFNLLNSNTELNRVSNAGSAVFNRLEEVMAPRIVRVGVRYGF